MRIECGNADDDDDYDDGDVDGNNKRRVNRILLHVTHIQNLFTKCSCNFQFSPIFFSVGMIFPCLSLSVPLFLCVPTFTLSIVDF